MDIDVISPTATPTHTLTPSPTPTFTPTPTFSQKAGDSIAQNTGTIVGGIITAILTAVIGYGIWLLQQKKKTPELKNIDITALNAKSAIRKIKKITDIDLLKVWLHDEDEKKNRKTVVKALNERINDLA